MDSKTASEEEFNAQQFEKRLTQLKDSQESINFCCQWCLNNRQHHKKIINSWLNVFKRVKVQHRLTLFYLANDVIQYSKRRHYDYVEGWATALQKATTMVRDDRIKHKILRIFKIWEERAVYSDEFISDLSGLIQATPSAPKNDEPHEFQANYLINKIKNCSNLESDTDLKLNVLKENNPKHLETDALLYSLKDRAQLDDTEKELEVHINHMEDYINALKLEIKNRITLISVLKQCETQLETDKKDVKIIGNAYKAFAVRVKAVFKKLEEKMPLLGSPVPSPDINAPSPSPDEDLELPGDNDSNNLESTQEMHYSNANYYNPVPAPNSETNSFASNGFTSFLGSNFNMENFDSTSIFSSENGAQTRTSAIDFLATRLPNMANPPPPSETGAYQPDVNPLLPPPMPPTFDGKSDTSYGSNFNSSFNNTGSSADFSFQTTDNYSSYSTGLKAPDPLESTGTSFDTSDLYSVDTAAYEPPVGANPYPPSDEYNPEQEPDTWEVDGSWPQPPLGTDTPESPPNYEKESFVRPVEYHDSHHEEQSGAALDVDQRVLPNVVIVGKPDLGTRGQDVDHRNLISLIGSPSGNDSNSNPPLPPPSLNIWGNSDQDYRSLNSAPPPLPPPVVEDQDYRLPIDLEQLKLPPPPPPPMKPSPNKTKKRSRSPVEIVDSNHISPLLRPDASLIPPPMNMLPPVMPPVMPPGMSGMMPPIRPLMPPPQGALMPPPSMEGMFETTAPMEAPPMFGGLEPPPPLPDFPDDFGDDMGPEGDKFPPFNGEDMSWNMQPQMFMQQPPPNWQEGEDMNPNFNDRGNNRRNKNNWDGPGFNNRSRGRNQRGNFRGGRGGRNRGGGPRFRGNNFRGSFRGGF